MISYANYHSDIIIFYLTYFNVTMLITGHYDNMKAYVIIVSDTLNAN